MFPSPYDKDHGCITSLNLILGRWWNKWVRSHKFQSWDLPRKSWVLSAWIQIHLWQWWHMYMSFCSLLSTLFSSVSQLEKSITSITSILFHFIIILFSQVRQMHLPYFIQMLHSKLSIKYQYLIICDSLCFLFSICSALFKICSNPCLLCKWAISLL